MSKKIEISEEFLIQVLKNGGVDELKKLIENLTIDRDFNLKMIEILEKKLLERDVISNHVDVFKEMIVVAADGEVLNDEELKDNQNRYKQLAEELKQLDEDIKQVVVDVLKNGGVDELKKLIENITIDGDFNLIMIEILEKKLGA